eukprot:scaffold1954_cov268-Pinguiococcus_pyrenoidosus.AAC.42
MSVALSLPSCFTAFFSGSLIQGRGALETRSVGTVLPTTHRRNPCSAAPRPSEGAIFGTNLLAENTGASERQQVGFHTGSLATSWLCEGDRLRLGGASQPPSLDSSRKARTAEQIIWRRVMVGRGISSRSICPIFSTIVAV